MRNRSYKHVGGNIRRTVRDAVRSGNFEEIGRAVEDGVQEWNDNVNGVMRNLRNAGRRPPDTYPSRPRRNACGGPAGRPYPPVNRAPAARFAFRGRMPGAVSGPVCIAAGSVMGIPLLVADIAAAAGGAAGFVSFADFVLFLSVVTPLAAFAFALAVCGIALRRRARRFARYRDAMGGADFCTVEKLADMVGETKERTKRDLKKMIVSGACPRGHLDRGETCFMVDDETYEAYLEAEKAYAARTRAEREEERKKKENPREAELDAVKKEGSGYLRQIRAANDALPGKGISEKLDRLESVTARIFECVGQHPEKLPDIRSFMRYYLPTTLKLVRSYVEFESQPVQGENIIGAKAEIEQALDTISTAFGNLLDSLFADDAFDVSTDISTLETMLRQSGLTGSDFAKNSDGGRFS